MRTLVNSVVTHYCRECIFKLKISISAGFYHKNDPSSIDLNVVRLCFEVVLEDDQGNFTIPLRPVVSDPVYDIKAMTELKICKLSDCYSPVNGNKDIILLCEKVSGGKSIQSYL